ncbi:MAG: hypothetical protein WEB03_11595 [Nitriliruptor sp.]
MEQLPIEIDLDQIGRATDQRRFRRAIQERRSGRRPDHVVDRQAVDALEGHDGGRRLLTSGAVGGPDEEAVVTQLALNLGGGECRFGLVLDRVVGVIAWSRAGFVRRLRRLDRPRCLLDVGVVGRHRATTITDRCAGAGETPGQHAGRRGDQGECQGQGEQERAERGAQPATAGSRAGIPGSGRGHA